MGKYVARRFIELIITLFLIGTATFFLLGAVPGTAIDGKIQKLPEATKQLVIKRYGYDKSLMERYVITLKNYAKGEFGESITTAGVTVGSIVKNKMPISARLGLQQIMVGVPIGLLLGIIAAMKKGKPTEHIILVGTMLLISVPSLVLALLLQKYLAGGSVLKLPIIGWAKESQSFLEGFKYTILPTIAGSVSYIASYSRLMKTSMMDSMNQEYVLTARAKGLSEAAIVRNHILKNSFIPIVTVLPVAISGVISGTLFIERVFAIPGAGQFFVKASSERDVSILLGLTMVFAIVYLLSIFISDILYTVVDPRIKLDK